MKSFSQEFLKFSNSSPTPFHCCKTAGTLLEAAGFVKVSESTPWALERGGKYYFTRNGSSLCAFYVGANYETGNAFKMIGAHSDSPVLKVKPVSKREGSGVEQVGVETYGGGLWHTWFDRDLGLAGRVIIRNQDTSFSQKLVHIKEPIMRIPTLAIHLQSSSERAAFAPNKEDHLVPLLSLLSEELNGPTGEGDSRHSPKLLYLLSQQLNCEPSQIVDFELTLCDTQDACLGGAFEEFVFAPRCDNQLHCYVSTQSLITTANLNNPNEDGVCMALLFDHEEVGSKSNEGAASPLLRDTIQRILNQFFETEDQGKKKNKLSAGMGELLKITAATSIFFSADCAHAVHPNYAYKHEKQHSPHMGKGTVIKTNMSQKYATNSVTGFFVRELARQNKVGYFEEGVTGFVQIPVQEFVVRNDVRNLFLFYFLATKWKHYWANYSWRVWFKNCGYWNTSTINA